MQVIGPTFASWAGPFRSTGPFEYGTSVNPEANIYAGLNYAIHRYGAGWTSVLGHGHGYAGGTSGAAPGWAMVGEKGPELVRFSGGETVLPNSMSAAMGGLVGGYAKGTHKSLQQEISKALEVINKHQDLPQQYNKLEIQLESWRGRLQQDNQLLKFGGLKGGAHRNLVAQQKHDSAQVKDLLKQIAPLSHERQIVRGVQALVDTQEKGLGQAIADAHSRGMNKLAGTLTHRKTRDQDLDKRFGNWLSRLGPAYTRKQQASDTNWIDSLISTDAKGAGLLPFGTFDNGGYLPTGLSLAYNGLGRPEPVGQAAAVVIQIQPGGQSEFDRWMISWLKKQVTIKGGGQVQQAFGATVTS
jgi:SLT domain-containing protein